MYRVEAYTLQRKTEDLVVDSKEIGLDMNADKTKYTVMPRDENGGQCHSIEIDDGFYESVEQLRYLGKF